MLVQSAPETKLDDAFFRLSSFPGNSTSPSSLHIDSLYFVQNAAKYSWQKNILSVIVLSEFMADVRLERSHGDR